MNKASKLIVTLAVLVSLPLAAGAAFAMQNMDHSSGMDHGSMNMDQGSMGKGNMDHGDMNMQQGGMMNMEHSGMDMQGDMIMLGDVEQNGVKAMAHLKDVHEAMAKMGMKTTHHLMVMFADMASGKPIDSGSVAVKITGPNGETSAPVKLMGMQGHFGADVVLTEPGAYHFTIGSKLADGKKRQFEFDYNLK